LSLRHAPAHRRWADFLDEKWGHNVCSRRPILSPIRLKISPASYIGRKDRFVKSFASSLGWLSARHLQLGNLPIIKTEKLSYNSSSFTDLELKSSILGKVEETNFQERAFT
jgi:hypothetical protein